MLRSKIGEGGVMRTYGFLVGVQIEGDPELEKLASRIADSITFVDGVGQIDVESLGEVDVYDGPRESTNAGETV